MSGHAQPAEKSSLATVKRSKLVVLDAFDTASAAFVGKFMDVSYFTCLDDIANAIDDLIALEDIYVSKTGDSDNHISTFELRSRIAFRLDSLEQRKRLERIERSNSKMQLTKYSSIKCSKDSKKINDRSGAL